MRIQSVGLSALELQAVQQPAEAAAHRQPEPVGSGVDQTQKVAAPAIKDQTQVLHRAIRTQEAVTAAIHSGELHTTQAVSAEIFSAHFSGNGALSHLNGSGDDLSGNQNDHKPPLPRIEDDDKPERGRDHDE